MATRDELIGTDSENLLNAYRADKFPEFVGRFKAAGYSLTLADFTATINDTSINSRSTVGKFISDYARPERIFLPLLWVGNLDTASNFMKATKIDIVSNSLILPNL